MSSVAVTIIGNDKGVQAMLHALDTALNPVALVGFLEGVVDPYLRGRAEDRFLSEGDDVTNQWAPLSPATEVIREDLGYGASHPINRRTGDLQRYITEADGNSQATPWGATLTLPGDAPTGELETKLIHAQLGGVSDSGKPFPARPVLGMNERDLIFVLTTLARHIERSGKMLGARTA